MIVMSQVKNPEVIKKPQQKQLSGTEIINRTAMVMLARELQTSVKSEVFSVLQKEAGSPTFITCPQAQFFWYE